MVKMKKGVLFTIGLLMMVSIVLTLAALNFRSSENSRDRLAELGSLERLYENYDSIDYGFKKIFNKYSGINVSLNNKDIIFEEFLPNNNAGSFNSKVDDYKDYINSQDNTIILDMEELKQELPLTVFPNNIIYKHSPFGGNKIMVNTEEINFNKYYVGIQPAFSINSCEWDTSPGSLTFQLKVNVPGCDDTVNLNPNSDNIIKINNNGLIIRINNSLTIENNLAASKIKVIISLNEMNNEQIMVFSDNGVISIEYPELSISKNSGFRII